MPDGIGSDASFFEGPAGPDGSAGEGQSGIDGVVKENPENPSIPGGPGASFENTEQATKRRGRPPGSKNKAKDGIRAGLDLGSTGDDFKDKEADKLARECYATIRARHQMLALMLGLPELALDDDKAKALAIAVVRFQQEFPQTKISRKASAVIDLGTAATAAYFPVIAGLATKARTARQNQNLNPKRGFYPNGQPNGAEPSAPTDTKPAPGGSEFVIMSGVTDKGKIDFGG